MRLAELEPRWIHPNVFAFRCPHCRKEWLHCKNVVMSAKEQRLLFEATYGEDWNLEVVPMKEGVRWKISGTDFATMTVQPSIDASPAGHWHGHITQGRIT